MQLICSTVCHWENDRIIVNGTVTIEPPFGESNIKGNTRDIEEVKEWVQFDYDNNVVAVENEVTFLPFVCLTIINLQQCFLFTTLL